MQSDREELVGHRDDSIVSNECSILLGWFPVASSCIKNPEGPHPDTQLVVDVDVDPIETCLRRPSVAWEVEQRLAEVVDSLVAMLDKQRRIGSPLQHQ